MSSDAPHVEAYLAALTANLRRRDIEPEPIVREARDHLLCELDSPSPQRAEDVVARFGDAELVAMTWALLRRAETARRASRAMLQRLLAIVLVGHVVAFVLPAAVFGIDPSGRGTVLAKIGVAGGALSVVGLLVLHAISTRPTVAGPWLARPAAGRQLYAVIAFCAAGGAIGTAGLASRLSNALAVPGTLTPMVLAAAALAAVACLLRGMRTPIAT